jgi:hypothetical protein
MHTDLEHEALLERLRELPPAPPPYGWQEFQRRAQLHAPAAGHPHRPLGSALLASVLVLALLAVLVRLGGVSGPSAPAELGPAAAETAASTAAMEHWLANQPREPALVRVGTRAAVMGLEDRIAQVDDLLSAERLEQGPAARLVALQQERTRLVGTLVQVRYAEQLAQESR